MECNKDEAVRAMQIAERKMVNNDFEGARKIAVRAKSLYPELMNIAQLLSICDVHCAAQNRLLGAERDWYGILQVEKLSDESTVKKQYRRLALSLHPDKNQFPGAEAAFKLICEAHAVLSDPSKKVSYDSRIRFVARSAPVNPPLYQMNRNFQQRGRQSNIRNGFSAMNQHQAAKRSSSVGPEFFWTICPFCSTNYQYSRVHINQNLQCIKCFKSFTGYETDYRGGNLASRWAPPSAQPLVPKSGLNQFSSSQVRTQQQCKSNTSVQNDKESSSSHVRSQFKPVILTERVLGGKRAARTADVSGVSKAKGRDSVADNLGKEAGKCNANAVNEVRGGVGNNTKKRGRKRVVESSESSGTSSESDLEDVTARENVNYKADNMFMRRSTRRRKHVSYQEGDDDDDYDDVDAGYGNDSDSKLKNKGVGAVRPEDTVPKKEASDSSDIDADTVEVKSDSFGDSNFGDKLDNPVFQCKDPEFHDFDKDRHESCFAADQIWACYDDAGTMPRYYAKVKKVHVSPFEVTIAWLEADPIDEARWQWVEAGLPVACGTFKLGKTAKISGCDVFSHQVHCDKGKKRNSFVIYPKAGEIWALFRDWHMNWSSNTEDREEFRYEIVEVISDFDPVSGIVVSYLNKVEGFVSVFQRSRTTELHQFVVGPGELYRFSHHVPSFKLALSEKSGPVDSVELDPASLPMKPDDLWYPVLAKQH